jgi:hypothetical protein
MSVEPVEPNNPREAVVAAGRDRLLRHALDALRSQLNASVLSAVAPVSRDTAYRVFRNDPRHDNVADAIVAAVSLAANDPAWTGYFDAMRDGMGAYQIAGDTTRDDESPVAAAVKAALRANFEAQFRAPGMPVSWLLHAAALTCSDAWKGEPPAVEDVALGRELLEHRRAFYDDVTDQLVSFFTVVMSDMGRRPRAGIDPATVIKLLHALSDGAVLRCLIEPGAIDGELVAEAMYLLAEMFTEEGPLADPRRPDDERGGKIFDRVVEAAADLWRTQPEVTVEAAAERGDVPLDAACLLFPAVGDLADSLIRTRVVGAGFTQLGMMPDDARAAEQLAGLVRELQNLRHFADELPHAVEATRQHPPRRTVPFVEDFVDNESRVVDALGVTPNPTQLVRDLVTFASRGSAGWPAVTALLRTLGHDAA